MFRESILTLRAKFKRSPLQAAIVTLASAYWEASEAQGITIIHTLQYILQETRVSK